MDYNTDAAALAVIAGPSNPVAIALARQLSAWQFDLLLVSNDDGLDWMTRLLQSEGCTAEGIHADLRSGVGVGLVHEEIVGRGEQVQVLIIGNGLALARRVVPLMIRADSGSVLITDDAPIGIERVIGQWLRGTSVTVCRLAPVRAETEPEEYARRAIARMMVGEVQAFSQAL